jgi:opacity protein-like surface antigen
MKLRPIAVTLALFVSVVQIADAAEFSLSGFGTAGYAISDKEYSYQRFIDDNGTIKRDTVFGVQADVKFNEQFSLTVQGKFAPSEKDDDKWSPDISWAFLSYRPSNNWLFRAGKLRAPVYLNSENMDVGITHDMARLPSEMYSLTPANDFLGASFSKTWSGCIGEFLLEGYWGKAPFYWRIYMRDDAVMLGGMPEGANFQKINMESTGFVMTFQRNSNIFRAGFHYATGEMADGSPVIGNYTLQPVYYPTPMGLMHIGDIYQPDTLNRITSNRNLIYVLGCDIDLGSDFRLIAEYGRRVIPDMDSVPDTHGGYVSLLKKIGKWTPYFTVSGLYSEQKVRDLYNAVDAYQLQGPGAFLNPTQRQIADSIQTYNQYTLAFGTSYSLTPKQKIKAEWAQTHVGNVSSFIDNPPGDRISDVNINVFSISYNFVF